MKNKIQELFVKKIVGLAPMAGYTDSAFRLLCREYGADLVYTELISARGLIEDMNSKDKKSWKLAEFEKSERPMFVQIFGSESHIMAEATKIIIDRLNPDGIDINMGCPAPKVVKNAYGSALMRNPEEAGKIIKAVKSVAGKTMVSVKTRLGWSKDDEILTFASILEAAGCDLVAIHARTKANGFGGDPNWEMVGKVKEKIKIPVLANGGIKNWQDVYKCLEVTKADGVLVGQAALGRPWIFDEIKQKKDEIFSIDEIYNIALRHIELYKKNNENFLELRKHLLQYFRGFDEASSLRSQISQCNNTEEFMKIFKNFRTNLKIIER